jgi:hypothetical protein
MVGIIKRFKVINKGVLELVVQPLNSQLLNGALSQL